MLDIGTLLDAAVATAGSRSKLKRAAKARGVRDSAEYRRIIELPTRDYTEGERAEMVATLTELLKTPTGTMTLREAQAQALWELGLYGRLVAQMRVGSGKTLVALLGPYVTGALRPLQILPANAIGPTQERQRLLSQHWRIPYWNHVVSYQALGRVTHDTYLPDLKPDFIAPDEAHMIANPRAAVTRKIKRYQAGDKAEGVTGAWVTFVPLSGTLTKRSIKNYNHLLEWSLGDYSPAPRTWHDTEEWADVIDEHPNDNDRQAEGRTKPGVLYSFGHNTEEIRKGYGLRIRQTPGVVATTDAGPSCSLEIYRHTIEAPKDVEAAVLELRSKWVAIDGWLLMAGLEVAACAKRLSLGFDYVWNPRPPADWLQARKEWQAFQRKDIRYNRSGRDSEKAVALACARGELDPTIYNTWKAIKKNFKPNKEVVWIDSYALEWCANWLSDKEPGILFCEHVDFAKTLSEWTGIPYCGEQSTDANGVNIEQHAGRPVIASLQSCHKIWNLQPWNRAACPTPPGSGYIWEQWLGRMHRDLQLADCVTYDILVQCLEYSRACDQARRDANYLEHTQSQPQKINIADWRWFEDPLVAPYTRDRNPRWLKVDPDE